MLSSNTVVTVHPLTANVDLVVTLSTTQSQTLFHSISCSVTKIVIGVITG